MPLFHYLIYVLLPAGVIISVLTKKLTISAAITGGIIGLLIYTGAGYTGISMLAFFFVAGSWATSWQASKKQLIGMSEDNSGQRTTAQVMANAATAAILGALVWLWPQHQLLFQLMMAGSLAAATADTLSSELGTLYGRRFYNIITLKKETRGLDGVVSAEGTLIGVLGAAIISLIYCIGFGWGIHLFLVIVAGVIGNIVDSLLGATLERKHHIGNNMVNFLNTLTGAVICLLMTTLIK